MASNDADSPPKQDRLPPTVFAGSPSMQVATSESQRHRLKIAANAGRIQRLDRGLYLVNPLAYSQFHELAAVAIRQPEAVICLESAAVFHELTSAPPSAVQFGIPRSTHAPRWRWPAIEPITWNLKPEVGGIEIHQIEGIPVRITTPARTVAECLRHLKKIGMSQFQEILWSAWRRKSAAADDVMRYASAFGISQEMAPYLATIQGS